MALGSGKASRKFKRASRNAVPIESSRYSTPRRFLRRSRADGKCKGASRKRGLLALPLPRRGFGTLFVGRVSVQRTFLETRGFGTFPYPRGEGVSGRRRSPSGGEAGLVSALSATTTGHRATRKVPVTLSGMHEDPTQELGKLLLSSLSCTIHQSPSRVYHPRKREEGEVHRWAVVALAACRANVLWLMLGGGRPYENRTRRPPNHVIRLLS